VVVVLGGASETGIHSMFYSDDATHTLHRMKLHVAHTPPSLPFFWRTGTLGLQHIYIA
jgi:hypothetical protein